MNRKKFALILLLAGMSVLCVLFVRIDERNAVFCIGKFDRLAIRVRTNTYEEVINPWYKEEEDTWYFFLPSGMNDKAIYNDEQEIPVLLDGRELAPFERFEWEEGREYRMVYDNIHGHNDLRVKFRASSEIPAVFIETESKVMRYLDESVYNTVYHTEKGTITVYEANGGVSYRGTLSIRGRGNSTWYSFDKRPYNIKLDKAGSLLGMERDRDWCLLANAWDYSYMNNKLAFDMASKAGFRYVPDAEYADVYFNGDYWGIYLITETVEVGESRISITNLREKNETANPDTDLTDEDTIESIYFDNGNQRGIKLENIPADITGGYLLERDFRAIRTEKYPVKKPSFFETSGYGTAINIKSPKFADLREVEYISALTSEMEQAIRSENGYSESGKYYLDYIDLESWVRCYMIGEIAHDPDKDVTNTYYYKDRDSIDSRFYSGPVWDYDMRFGGKEEQSSPEVLTRLATGGWRNTGGWSQYLYEKPEFYSEVCREWNRFFKGYLQNEMPGKTREWQEQIRKSVEMDLIRWPRGKGYSKKWPAEGEQFTDVYSYDDQAEYLRTWLTKRCEFLDGYWGDGQ